MIEEYQLDLQRRCIDKSYTCIDELPTYVEQSQNLLFLFYYLHSWLFKYWQGLKEELQSIHVPAMAAYLGISESGSIILVLLFTLQALTR